MSEEPTKYHTKLGPYPPEYTVEKIVADDEFKWGVIENGKIVGRFASKEQAEHVKESLERKPAKQ